MHMMYTDAHTAQSVCVCMRATSDRSLLDGAVLRPSIIYVTTQDFSGVVVVVGTDRDESEIDTMYGDPRARLRTPDEIYIY